MLPLDQLGGPISLFALAVALLAFFAQALNRQSDLRSRGERPRFRHTETAFRLALIVALVAIVLLSLRMVFSVGRAIYQVWGVHLVDSTDDDTYRLIARVDTLVVTIFFVLAIAGLITSVGYITPLLAAPRRWLRLGRKVDTVQRVWPPSTPHGWHRTDVVLHISLVETDSLTGTQLWYSAQGDNPILDTEADGPRRFAYDNR